MGNIDGYQIFAELKSGPVATIFKAFDPRHHQIVLVKLLHAEAVTRAHWREQFLRENRLSMRLTHPNLRRTLYSGTHGDQPFLVLEYVEGPTLFELICRHKKMPIELCIFIAKELAHAIAAVHESHVLHRDIKPQNIFLSMTGNVKLGDLGLAQELADADPLLSGTPAYMSPEYILGRPLNEASDLFSFGAVLYEIITGEVAFVNRTLAGTLLHVANWEPVPIMHIRSETPPELVAICQKLLAKDPGSRYGRAEAVLEDLSRVEKMYDLSTSKHNLAAFLEAPDDYCPVKLRSRPLPVPYVPQPAPALRHTSLNWGVTALMSATMFLAGVLFIKGIKEYQQYQLGSTAAAKSNSAPKNIAVTTGGTGYLDLSVKPWGLVAIDGDTIGRAPLSEPLALPSGLHEISAQHPTLGRKTFKALITNGDTLRQALDLTKP